MVVPAACNSDGDGGLLGKLVGKGGCLAGWALIQGGIGFVAPTRHCLRFFTHMRGGT